MRFLSNLQQGYLPGTDYNDIDPLILSRHYGTEGQPRLRPHGQTGAGHYDLHELSVPSQSTDTSSADQSDPETSDEETSSDSEDTIASGTAQCVAQDQQHHVRHPPIPVPESSSPFTEENVELFLQALHEVRQLEIVPQGLGVSPAEWPDGLYGNLETINFGRGGRQEDIELPFAVWWRRAVEWAQALELMTAILIEQQADL